MPWNTKDTMSLREEFVLLALQEGSNRRELCRRFGISPQTAYKWLARHQMQGRSGLLDRSRRPDSSPHQTSPDLERLVVRLRTEHPCWGGRKLSRRLQDQGYPALAPSTITRILHRHGLIEPQHSEAAKPWQRFEHPSPNDLWQMDFKGTFATSEGPCYPLTILDDHSRYSLSLHVCARPNHQCVQEQMTHVFRRYGLPVRINTDNGSPWGSPTRAGQITALSIWLIRLGIRVGFSRPYHPQTNGKEERFHRSLKAEVLNGRSFTSLKQVQTAFDIWREIYNHQRPHEALELATPVTRYRVSPRIYPEWLPEIEYGPDDIVMVPTERGMFKFQGRSFKVSNSLHGLPVALRPDPLADGVFQVYFSHHKLMQIDLRTQLESS